MRFLAVLLWALLWAGPVLAQQAGTGWLGVELRDLTKEEADALGWDEPRGAKVVMPVPGGPAEAAGLQPDDVLLSLDGMEIVNMAAFVAAVGAKAAGTEIRLAIRRGSRERRIAATLAPRPAQFAGGREEKSRPHLMLDTGGHMALIRSVVFTPDGKQLVSGSDDKTIRVWDLATGNTVRTIRGESAPGDPGKIYAMALSSDGKWLAAGGYLGSFTGTKARVDEGAHKIRLYDFASGRQVALLKGHEDVVNGLAFSLDGRHLISGSADTTAILWDLGPLSGAGAASVSSARVEIRPKRRLTGHTDHIYAVGFTPDGARAVTGSYDHDVRLWRVADGQAIGEPMKGHGDKVRSLAVALDGTIASGDVSGEIRLWDAASESGTGERTSGFRKTLARQGTEVGSLSFSPDGKMLLSGSGVGLDHYCHVYDLASGREIIRYEGHDNVVLTTAISPDGHWAATGGGNNSEIHLWDLRTGERRLGPGSGSGAGPDDQPLTLGGQGRPVWAAGFAADGQSIAWGNTWQQHDPTRGYGSLQHVLALPSAADALPRPGDLGASEQGTFRRAMANQGGWSLQHRKGGGYGYDAILDILQDGKTVASIERGSIDGYNHRSYSLTPDGETIISGGGNGWLTAYDRAGNKLGDFIGHENDVWAVAPSPDGRFLVSGSADQTIRLWNIKTRELLATLFHGADGEWVMWTPQGYYVGSPKGAELVGWQINKGADKEADYVSAAQLRRTLRRPDIIARTIELASATAAVAEAPGTDRGFEELLARSLPKLSLISPKTGDTVRGGAARIAFDLSATDDPVKLIRVSVNGIQLKDEQPRSGGGFAPGRIDITVPVARGENAITIVAVNTEGYESEPLRVRLTHSGEGNLDRRGTLYLISIGVDAYPSLPATMCTNRDAAGRPTCDLRFAGKDASAFHEAMLRGLGPLHERVVDRILVNAPGRTAPTADAIRDVLGLLRLAKPTDTVAVFLSGHGYNEGRDYMLLPTDAEWMTDIKVFRRAKAVLWPEIQTAIQNAQGRRILFMDTCHSGNSHAGGLDEAAYYANIVAFYSARWDQLAVEAAKYGHGAFTKAVIEGMSGAANADGDRQVTTVELRDYLSRRVPELALEQKRQQNPQFFQARDAQVYSLARVE